MHGGCETCGCNWPTYPPRGWPALPLCLKVYLGATCINALLVQALMHMQLWYSCETCGRNWPTTPSRLTWPVLPFFVCVYSVQLSYLSWNVHKNSPATNIWYYATWVHASQSILVHKVLARCPNQSTFEAVALTSLKYLHLRYTYICIYATPYFTAYEVIGLMSKTEHLWATCNQSLKFTRTDTHTIHSRCICNTSLHSAYEVIGLISKTEHLRYICNTLFHSVYEVICLMSKTEHLRNHN